MLLQIILMLLQNVAKRTLDFIDLDFGKPNLLSSARLRVSRADDDPLPSRIVVEWGLKDVFSTHLLSRLATTDDCGPAKISDLKLADALTSRTAR